MWCPTTKRRHTEQPPTKWWTPSQDPPVWIPAGDPCDHFRCESNVRSENTDQSRLPSGSACTAEETDWEQTHLAGRETYSSWAPYIHTGAKEDFWRGPCEQRGFDLDKTLRLKREPKRMKKLRTKPEFVWVLGMTKCKMTIFRQHIILGEFPMILYI